MRPTPARIRCAQSIVCLLSLTGCHPTPTVSAPSTTSTVAAATAPVAPIDGGEEVFDSVCRGCHDQPDPIRPDFSQPMDRHLAARALRAVLHHEMPPREADVRAELTDARLAALLAWICRGTGRSEEMCARLLADELSPPTIRAGATILATLKARGGAEVSKERSRLLMDASRQSERDMHGRAILSPIFAATVLLVTIDSCSPPASPSASGSAAPGTTSEDRARCLERTIHDAIVAPARPAP